MGFLASLTFSSLAAVKADSAPPTSVFVVLPNSTSDQVWRFSAGDSKGTDLGKYERPTDIAPDQKPAISVSPDGKWIAIGYIAAEPPHLLQYGQVGQTLKTVEAAGKADYIFGFGFSPDSLYLTYTLRTQEWTLGIIDLQSGLNHEFTGASAGSPPDLNDSISFGNMIPNVVSWSGDGKTVYFETSVLWGCRGPHALYSATTNDLLNSRQPLPPTRRVTPKDADVFSYDFSPDRAFVTFAYDNTSCGVPTRLGIIDLKTNRFQELTKASTGRALLVLGWANDGKMILFTSDPAPEGDSGPGFPLTTPRVLTVNRSGGGLDKLADLTSSADQQVENTLINKNTMWFTLAPGADATRGPYTLYTRQINGKTAEASSVITAEQGISVLLCGETLFFTTEQSDKMALYRTVVGNQESQKLLEAPQIELAGCGQ